MRAGLGRDVRIVAVTGCGQALDRRRGEDAGIDEYRVKPVDSLDRPQRSARPVARTPCASPWWTAGELTADQDVDGAGAAA